MTTRTKAEQLDEGAPTATDPTDADLRAWSDAFYGALIGRSTSPTKFGFFLSRIARTVDGATVTANVHTAALPGPVLHVQATAGTSTGPKIVVLSGTPASGQVKIETNAATGRDTLTFAADDAVTACMYRQQAMPVEMYDQLVADTDPPISDA